MGYRCHALLSDISSEGFSAKGLKQLTGSTRRFPHRLEMNQKDIVVEQTAAAPRMSISGVQDKISLVLNRGELQRAELNGEYILKPVPGSRHLHLVDDAPANEHLTMQLASQLFDIETAANGCLHLSDGSMAYVTRRFDYRDGAKIAQEDFCQLSQRSPETHGEGYKYNGTYEEMGRLLKKHCSAYPVEIEKLFRLIVFNYAISNGDAHLKNFSMYQSPYGDYILTPAYDLLCSSMHVPNESRTALELFDDYETTYYKTNGFYGREDFMELACRYGIPENRADKIISRFHEQKDEVYDMISRSFLSSHGQADYLDRYNDRLNALK